MSRSVVPVVEGESRIAMSYEEYAAWVSDQVHTEWVNGEAVILMPPTIPHQKVINFLETLLTMFAGFFRLGQVLSAPSEMRIWPEGNAREPDIFFVETANLSRLANRRLNGPADLVIEVVSDESATRDRVEKFSEYEAGKVREYWVIDPRAGRERAEFWQLDAEGRYQPVLPKRGIYRSAVLRGFWLKTSWLLSNERPDPVFAFAEVTGLPQEIVEKLQQVAEAGPPAVPDDEAQLEG
jgi:Uma2 family endonuclease